MATYRKTDSGKWLVEVCVNGRRKSKTRRTKKEAEIWAADMVRMLEADPDGTSSKTVKDALERYMADVVPRKKSPKRESLFVSLLLRNFPWLMSVKLHELTTAHLARWRDERLDQVSSSTVVRELNVLAHCLNTARREWQWMTHQPTKDLRRPKPNEPRTRLPTDAEIERICENLGNELETISGRVALAVRFALETSMRCAEICNIRPELVSGNIVQVIDGKTGNRQVPVSNKALSMLDLVGKNFQLQPSQIGALWQKARNRCMIRDLHFHDLRAACLTRLSKQMDVMDLAKVSGHKDIRILYNT